MKNIVINNISTSYYITEHGGCFNSITHSYLKGQQDDKKGYLFYTLTLPDGKKTKQYAHKLVAVAYLPREKGKNWVRHKDGNTYNNYIDNLEWVEFKINQKAPKTDHVFCFSKDKVLVAEYLNIQQAAKAAKIPNKTILQELDKEIKSLVGGFYWSKKEVLGPTKVYLNTGRSKRVHQYDLNGRYLATYDSVGMAARIIGDKNSSHISECCRGKIKSYRGFIWRYVEDIVLTFEETQRDNCKLSEKMESSWSGTIEDSYYNGEHFDRCRKILQPEYSHSGRSAADSYYIVSGDVGRRGCDSVACIIKVTPQGIQPAIKSLVNIVVIPADLHFEDQAIMFKKLYYKYRARRLVLDANGLGIGLVDYMVKPQTDPDTGEILPDFGVFGGTQDNAAQEYKKYRTPNTEEDALYLIKANAPVNTECYSALQVALSTGKIRLLIDDIVAREKLLNTVRGKKMTPEERDDYLRPFKLTTILKEEILNLREENEGINVILKRANKGIQKDKFSALIYGLYYIKLEEESKKRKKRFSVKDFMFKN